ncbi:MAG: DUF4296 domain-containing protein [Bacteroidales bacterium]|nr:DUF4296 domain-containing protein [Bacteroidales bacterium]
MRWLLCIPVLVLILVSCAGNEHKVPEGILSPEKMSMVLADTYITEAVISNMQIPYDSLRKSREAYYQALYRKHGISREEFDSSYHYYEKHLEILEKIQDDAITELMKREAEVE